MLATLGQDEIVRVRLPVVEEVVLDGSGPEAQTENELVVSEVGVVAHDMPEHRTVPDRHHRLRRGVFAGPHAQAQASAEDHDLHLMYPLAPRTVRTPLARVAARQAGLPSRGHMPVARRSRL